MHGAASRDTVVHETCGRVVGAVGRLLRACEEDGSVRPGLAPQDVPLLMGFLGRVGGYALGRDRDRRVSDLVANGRRTGGG
ncbi:hypothetical protein ABZZ36_19170 [Actinacidiphila glaucinigra]|uniref:SbtR family transcriptional regulator n=1 Tax=Actinacidiphila glaucinigra TaxID=235986 RepID=UPI0033BE01AD